MRKRSIGQEKDRKLINKNQEKDREMKTENEIKEIYEDKEN